MFAAAPDDAMRVGVFVRSLATQIYNTMVAFVFRAAVRCMRMFIVPYVMLSRA